ncbi:hypothetical protein N3K66_004755 [Trichothecium roseum]|uniref:Uncharacterized protein n=1 Tax=Trichothecium roseum TaxID=47278 RepID=A0ACC0V3U2_9HYPO|nr:hypothetical protein N3K66_004755 [Trichothecium roseum]
MFWSGSHWLTYPQSRSSPASSSVIANGILGSNGNGGATAAGARAKVVSRRTHNLLWLPEAIRLKTLAVHIRETSASYTRRKRESAALTEHCANLTEGQPNFRLTRSLRGLRGLDHLLCLRGLASVDFFDFDCWLASRRVVPVRDYTFSQDVRNSACRPKEPDAEERSRVRNLAPLLAGCEVGEESWVALEAFLEEMEGEGSAGKGSVATAAAMSSSSSSSSMPAGMVPKERVTIMVSDDEDDGEEEYDDDDDDDDEDDDDASNEATDHDSSDDDDDDDDGDDDGGGGGGGEEAWWDTLVPEQTKAPSNSPIPEPEIIDVSDDSDDDHDKNKNNNDGSDDEEMVDVVSIYSNDDDHTQQGEPPSPRAADNAIIHGRHPRPPPSLRFPSASTAADTVSSSAHLDFSVLRGRSSSINVSARAHSRAESSLFVPPPRAERDGASRQPAIRDEDEDEESPWEYEYDEDSDDDAGLATDADGDLEMGEAGHGGDDHPIDLT